MTTIIKVLEELQTWAQEELCSTFKFKVPPDGEFKQDDENYEYRREYPNAYILYPDIKDKRPSVTIQYPNGTISEDTGKATINFVFAIWNNGNHYIDENGVPAYQEHKEGYRDVWNWIDLSVQKLRKTEYIGDYIRIRHEDSISISPPKEDGLMPNYYPIFGATISFQIQYGVPSTQINDEFI